MFVLVSYFVFFFPNQRLGRAMSASKVVATTGMESSVNFAHDNHASEQLTIAAWGGQRSNQEVRV